MLSLPLHSVVVWPLKQHPAGALPLLQGRQLCCCRAQMAFPLAHIPHIPDMTRLSWAGCTGWCSVRWPDLSSGPGRGTHKIKHGLLPQGTRGPAHCLHARWSAFQLNRLRLLLQGVMACPEMRTRQGHEYQLGVNHLGHYLLTLMLLPLLQGHDRCLVHVCHSSACTCCPSGTCSASFRYSTGLNSLPAATLAAHTCPSCVLLLHRVPRYCTVDAGRMSQLWPQLVKVASSVPTRQLLPPPASVHVCHLPACMHMLYMWGVLLHPCCAVASCESGSKQV